MSMIFTDVVFGSYNYRRFIAGGARDHFYISSITSNALILPFATHPESITIQITRRILYYVYMLSVFLPSPIVKMLVVIKRLNNEKGKILKMEFNLPLAPLSGRTEGSGAVFSGVILSFGKLNGGALWI